MTDPRPFVPGEYPEYPYWKDGRVIATQPPLDLQPHPKEEPDASNTDTSTTRR